MSVVRRLDEAAQGIPLRARSLTDLQLKALKPRDKADKVSDRDGLYAYVAPSGRPSACAATTASTSDARR